MQQTTYIVWHIDHWSGLKKQSILSCLEEVIKRFTLKKISLRLGNLYSSRPFSNMPFLRLAIRCDGIVRIFLWRQKELLQPEKGSDKRQLSLQQEYGYDKCLRRDPSYFFGMAEEKRTFRLARVCLCNCTIRARSFVCTSSWITSQG